MENGVDKRPRVGARAVKKEKVPSRACQGLASGRVTREGCFVEVAFTLMAGGLKELPGEEPGEEGSGRGALQMKTPSERPGPDVFQQLSEDRYLSRRNRIR